MSDRDAETQPNPPEPAGRPEPVGRPVARIVTQLALLAVLGVIAVWSGWKQAGLYTALILLTVAVNVAVIRRANPDLLRQRMKRDRPTEPFDKVVLMPSAPLSVAVFVVAGLDVLGYRWSPVPPAVSAIGVALHLIGGVPVAWSMAANPYLERVVRVQEERGHRAITTGPYRLVRHPMYVGVLLMLAGWPLILGSYWACAPAALLGLLIVARTHFEDRMLARELAGYGEYMRQTPYRLLPGVW